VNLEGLIPRGVEVGILVVVDKQMLDLRLDKVDMAVIIKGKFGDA
jgi:hypothetical protein